MGRVAEAKETIEDYLMKSKISRTTSVAPSKSSSVQFILFPIDTRSERPARQPQEGVPPPELWSAREKDGIINILVDDPNNILKRT